MPFPWQAQAPKDSAERHKRERTEQHAWQTDMERRDQELRARLDDRTAQPFSSSKQQSQSPLSFRSTLRPDPKQRRSPNYSSYVDLPGQPKAPSWQSTVRPSLPNAKFREWGGPPRNRTGRGERQQPSWFNAVEPRSRETYKMTRPDDDRLPDFEPPLHMQSTWKLGVEEQELERERRVKHGAAYAFNGQQQQDQSFGTSVRDQRPRQQRPRECEMVNELQHLFLEKCTCCGLQHTSAYRKLGGKHPCGKRYCGECEEM